MDRGECVRDGGQTQEDGEQVMSECGLCSSDDPKECDAAMLLNSPFLYTSNINHPPMVCYTSDTTGMCRRGI